MFLISLAFAFIAFIVASNVFSNVWQWIVAAVVTFAAFALIITLELETLLMIAVGIFALLLIVLLIAKRKR